MLSRKTRDRLNAVASILDGWAARIRKFCKKHTPPKRAKAAEDLA